MPKAETGPLHLRRIDPARNMRRFYVLSIQPTLFGGASLIRNWGRIGTNGQAMMETSTRARMPARRSRSSNAGSASADTQHRRRLRDSTPVVEVL